MGGLIQGGKDKIWSIANELVVAQPAPQLKFGLIGYRDRGDAYVTKVTGLPDEEQKAAIKKKVAERKELQAKMDALVKKRSEHNESEKKKQAAAGHVDSFDMKVKEMIKDQGATRGIEFNHQK